MIDDMALLKQVMEQMDAEDPAVAQTAKDRAAQILSDAKLNFSKMAELIEQRRLLLRPRIVAGIKRMDQPGMLGDAAFRDTGRAPKRRSDLWSNCRSNRTYRQTLAPIRGSGREERAAAPDGERAAVRNGERAGHARVAESAPFCREHCFLSAATSHTVPRDRTPCHFALLRLERFCFPRPASSEIFRRHCRRPPQRRSGDIVGEFFHT
jgi:hypothetical protein